MALEDWLFLIQGIADDHIVASINRLLKLVSIYNDRLLDNLIACRLRRQLLQNAVKFSIECCNQSTWQMLC